jgi:RimJ/RimL family protein N-acetyltransferase
LLEGRNLNLRIMEKEDIPLILEWLNNPEFYHHYFSPIQRTRSEVEKAFESNPFEFKQFIIEKKNGTKIGFIAYCNVLHPWGKIVEMGYGLVPSERGKGYCTEAANIMVDYLFLSKEIECIQATTDIGNVASQKVLEKAGFKKEGVMRKRFFYNGEWKNMVLSVWLLNYGVVPSEEYLGEYTYRFASSFSEALYYYYSWKVFLSLCTEFVQKALLGQG